MTTLAAPRLPAKSATGLHLMLLAVWRLLFALAAIAGVLLLWLWPEFMPVAQWMRILASVLLAGSGVASMIAALDIRQRRHRGRSLSLLVDYLGAIVSLFGFLQVTGALLFTDGMADTFGRGLIALGVALVGYLISTVGDRFENAPRAERRWRRAGYTLAGLALVAFAIVVEMPRGVLYLAGQLGNPAALGLLAATLLFGVALWAMWRAPTAAAMNAQTHHEQMLNGWLFLSPNLIGFLIFFAGPLLLSLYFSFTDSDAFNPPVWVGLDNYARILNLTVRPLESATQPAAQVLDISIYDELWRFTLFGSSYIFGAADRLFWLALRNTILFAVLSVPLSVLPALVLANILNSDLPGMKFFRAVYFLPSIAAIVGISLVWQLLYNATIGYINYFVTLGVNFWNGLFGTALADPKIQWLSDERTALLSLVILFAWQTLGFNAVLFMAGMQNIPKVLYEAATVDGAGRWARFAKVTIPLLAPTTFFVLVTTTIRAMQVFEQVFILMNPPEGPNNSTVTLVLYLYRSGFQNFRQGYASAIAWVLFLVIFGLTLVQFRRERSSNSMDT